MSVIDILKIEEVNHIYILKFRLVLEWYTKFLLTSHWESPELRFDILYFCFKGMIIASSTWIWRRQGHRTRSLLKTCTGSGSLSLCLTTQRRMKQQRWDLFDFCPHILLRVQKTPSWHWQGRATSLEAKMTMLRRSTSLRASSTGSPLSRSFRNFCNFDSK